jgi:hypothetical protein
MVAIPRLITHSLVYIVGVRSVMANFRGRVWHVTKDVVSSESTDTQKLRPFKLSRRPEVIKYSHTTIQFCSEITQLDAKDICT